jgi:O-antigen/teichoic acid export membrane protein
VEAHPDKPDPPAAQSDAAARGTARFIRRGSQFMILDNLSKGLDPLLVLLCAKLYAGGAWGQFKYFESLVLLLARLSSLGLENGVIWIRSRCADDDEYVRFFSRTLAFVGIAALLLSGLAAMQSFGWLPGHDWLGKRVPQADTLETAAFLLSVPLQALTVLLVQAYLTKRVLKYGLLIRNFLIPVATYAPAVGLAFTSGKGHALAACYFVGNLAGFLAALIGFLRLYRGHTRAWSFVPALNRAILRFSLPIASTGLILAFAVRLDILLLARYAGTQAIEIYSVVVMISNTLRAIRQSMDGVMLAVFSEKGQDVAAKRRHFNFATWLVVSLQIPFFFLALVFGSELLALLGPVYAPGGPVLVAAMGFNLLVTMGAFFMQVLLGMGKTLIIPISQGIFFLATAASTFLLIPRYGAMGAAVAMGASNALGVAVLFAGARYYHKTWFFNGKYLAALGLECACFAPTLLLPASGFGLPLRAAVFAASLAACGFYGFGRWRRWSPAERVIA